MLRVGRLRGTGCRDPLRRSFCGDVRRVTNQPESASGNALACRSRYSQRDPSRRMSASLAPVPAAQKQRPR